MSPTSIVTVCQGSTIENTTRFMIKLVFISINNTRILNDKVKVTNLYALLFIERAPLMTDAN